MKRILIITLGGTILSKYDPENQSVAPLEDTDEFLSSLVSLKQQQDGVKLESYAFRQLPGPHLNPHTAQELAAFIEEREERYDGFVILQGTDTLEEFSYLLSLLTVCRKPVVFTGAMKSQSEDYADAIGNIKTAVAVASSDEAQGRGVLVTFHEKIFLPKDVRKMHTRSVDAFDAPNTGPIGSVYDGEPRFWFAGKEPQHFGKKLQTNIVLLTAALDMDPFLLEASIQRGVKGIVIEGFGAGNLPAAWEDKVRMAIEQGIPVVMTTRCPYGDASGLYDYKGGGHRLKQMGAVYAPGYSGAKARLLLMAILGNDPSIPLDRLQAHFAS